MQRFLVPLDGSELAEQALPRAKDLATRLSGTLFLVRVVTISRHLAASGMTGPGGPETIPALDIQAMNQAIDLQTREAREYLAQQSEKLQQEGLRVEWEVRQGFPAEEIIHCAKAHNVDVIVITTHGRSGLGRLVFGSVFDRVMREAGIPILVISPPRRESAASRDRAGA
ncbi:MAG: universal stress protein [Chloroflexi bacterium]|nr:universal stress protein [Chloroflexota bacterium]